MTKAELIVFLNFYPDDACIEVVRNGEHFDVRGVLRYNDNGVIVAELITDGRKTIPESQVRLHERSSRRDDGWHTSYGRDKDGWVTI